MNGEVPQDFKNASIVHIHKNKNKKEFYDNSQGMEHNKYVSWLLNSNTGVKFQFRTSCELFNHRQFKATIGTIIYAAAALATSLCEAQELMNRFSTACKEFGLIISIKIIEVVMPNVRGVQQPSSAHTLPPVSITVYGKELKYLMCKNQQFRLS